MSPSSLAHGLLAILLTAAAGLGAAPVTMMGDLGEQMAHQALGGSTLRVVDVQHGRHGMDLVYYDQVAGQERLHIAEVKAGGSQQARHLQLTDDELKLLRQHGIQPESLGQQRYQITQGSHGYNLVQARRATERQVRLDRLVSILREGGALSPHEVRDLANHFARLDSTLTPADRHLLEKDTKGNAATLRHLRHLYRRHATQLISAHAAHGEELQRIERAIQTRQYTNQLLRVDSQGGRFSIVALALDDAGKLMGTPREIGNINWKNYRASGPFRSLVKDHARLACAGERLCVDRAYRAAIGTLEQQGNLHHAMQQMTQAAQGAPSVTPPAAGNQRALTPAQPTASARPAVRPSAVQIAPELRKAPLLQRIGQFVSRHAGAQTGQAAQRATGILAIAAIKTTSVMSSMAAMPMVAPIALAIGGGILFDHYLDNKIGTHVGELQNHLGKEFAGVNDHIAQWGEYHTQHLDAVQQDIAQWGQYHTQHLGAIQQDIAQWGQYQAQYLNAIQQDLTLLGGQVEYGFALTLETIDRHSQQLAGQLETLDTRMDIGFSSLSQALFLVDLKQDYGLAIQEAMFEDALQAGVKHYDVYLGTGARASLDAADHAFTLAQARYENLLDQSATFRASADQAGNLAYAKPLQYALASYYRAIVHAERASEEPRFATQAVQTFIAFADRIREPELLDAVLPILNETYIAIADVDLEDLAGQRLNQAYAGLIDHHLGARQHNRARALGAMLRMVRTDEEALLLDRLANYVTGEDHLPPERLPALAGDWNRHLDARERPRPGTVYALLACADHEALGEISALDCQIAPTVLIETARTYDNEALHRYAVTQLLRANRVTEAKEILETFYIADTAFRLKNQLAVAYFQRHEPGDALRYCRMAHHILSDSTFPDTLREEVRSHLQRWGGFCPQST